jgi:hypothetical protein
MKNNDRRKTTHNHTKSTNLFLLDHPHADKSMKSFLNTKIFVAQRNADGKFRARPSFTQILICNHAVNDGLVQKTHAK